MEQSMVTFSLTFQAILKSTLLYFFKTYIFGPGNGISKTFYNQIYTLLTGKEGHFRSTAAHSN